MKLHPRKRKADHEQSAPEENQEGMTQYQHETNIADGAEFLDDAIRMKDQPLEETDLNNSKQEN